MPAGDLTDLATVKGWLNIAATADDALLSRLITAASAKISAYIQRSIGTGTYTEVRNGSGTHSMMLGKWPVTAVTSVTVNSATIPKAQNGGAGWYAPVWDGSTFMIPEPYVILTSGYTPIAASFGWGLWNGWFPTGAGNVTIIYTAGFTTTPADIVQACVELVAQMYQRRTRIDLKSVNQATQSTSYEMQMTPGIKELLNPYKRVAPVML